MRSAIAARGWLIAVAIACALAILRTAWLSDDSYITLRTIDNVWHGYGLRWNVVERVQSFTDPLWMLLLAAVYGVTREAFFTTLMVSFACVAATLALLLRRLSTASATLAIACFTASRAFVEFSTSGLENPLSHLLLAAFWLIALDADEHESSPLPPPTRLIRLAVLASLCALTRLDLALLVGPALIVLARCVPPRTIARAIAWAILPLIAWYAFALIYYGSLIPNTALAKLDTGIPAGALAAQGLRYLQESWTNDPITLSIVTASLALAIWKRRALSLAFACGIVLYLVYVVRVGGDFMAGRFLTPAFLCATVFLAREAGRWLDDRLPALVGVSIAVMVVGVGLQASRAGERVPFFHGILDEQRIYYPYTGLFADHRPAEHSWARTGASLRLFPRVMAYEAVGLLGYHAGPGVHIIDPMGLTDPLIARQPALPEWRIGHFKRAIPGGYAAGLEECLRRVFPHGAVAPPTQTCLAWPAETNRIADPALARQYDAIRLVTEGPLFSIDRWRMIVGLAQ